MLRISEKQSKLLFGKKPPSVGKPSAPRAEYRLAEKAIVDQVKDFLALHGYELHRQHVGTFVPYRQFAELKDTGKNKSPVIPVTIGTKAMCDWMAIKPLGYRSKGLAQIIEIEIKRPGKTPDVDQLAYIQRRLALGFLATWTDGIREGAAPLAPWFLEHCANG